MYSMESAQIVYLADILDTRAIDPIKYFDRVMTVTGRRILVTHGLKSTWDSSKNGSVELFLLNTRIDLDRFHHKIGPNLRTDQVKNSADLIRLFDNLRNSGRNFDIAAVSPIAHDRFAHIRLHYWRSLVGKENIVTHNEVLPFLRKWASSHPIQS